MINDSKSSAGLRRFKGVTPLTPLLIAGAGASILIAAFASWIYAHGFILYYGDAQAHLNISRGVVDSRTPGYEQLGSVWLPVLHVICLPFVASDFLWSTGLAATIPVAICFVASIVFFYLAALEVYEDFYAAAITALCIALNPNVLYLASIPMTEVVFFAGLSVQLWALLRFRRTQSTLYVLLAAAASIWASLTRYDGWFLIPFVAGGFFLFARAGRIRTAVLFGAIASLGPLYWIGHNYWETGDPLSFYRGPYSAKGIYLRGLAAGQPRDPGDHNWPVAIRYYFEAGRLCSGWPLIVLGGLGIMAAFAKRRAFAVLFLLLTPCFYVWGMYSSGNPIHVPGLWPFSYYNTRYGIAFVPLCAFGAGALVLLVPDRLRRFAAILPLMALLPWLVHPSHETWICWKESQHNSESRRFWTNELAEFFRTQYQYGDGILYAHGDVPGILCRARIPIAEALHSGNGPAWLANTYRPDLFRTCKWAVVLVTDADPLARAIDKANWKKTVYQQVMEIHTKYDPVVRVYRRTG